MEKLLRKMLANQVTMTISPYGKPDLVKIDFSKEVDGIPTYDTNFIDIVKYDPMLLEHCLDRFLRYCKSL